MALSVSACVVRVRVAARRGVNQWSVRKCGGGGDRGGAGTSRCTHIYTYLHISTHPSTPRVSLNTSTTVFCVFLVFPINVDLYIVQVSSVSSVQCPECPECPVSSVALRWVCVRTPGGMLQDVVWQLAAAQHQPLVWTL